MGKRVKGVASQIRSTPKDTRLALRVSADDLRLWRDIAAYLEGRSLSAMIRDVVNRYVAHPVPSFDFFELPYRVLAELPGVDSSMLRGMTCCDKTIVLRVSAAERQRWTVAAKKEGRSLSGMIRRAVKRHASLHMEIFAHGMKKS